MLQRPAIASIDGIRLDLYEPGQEYDVGNALGALLLAEQWAQPVVAEDPLPSPQQVPDTPKALSNLIREYYPPYLDRHGAFGPVISLDRRRRARRR